MILSNASVRPQLCSHFGSSWPRSAEISSSSCCCRVMPGSDSDGSSPAEDDWESNDDADDDELDQEEESKQAPKRRKAAAKAKSKHAKAKAKSRAEPKQCKKGSKKCFAAHCQTPKAGKARFCSLHRPMADGILQQAVEQGKEEDAQQLLHDEAKCSMALIEWERDNPPGKYRKKLIDWAAWQRKFDIKTKVTIREGETAWSWEDFCEEKEGIGWIAGAILKKWQKWQNDSNVGKAEENGKEILWVPDRKRRMRDNVKEVCNTYLESSKNMKKVKLSDANSLKDFAHLSKARFSDKFFKEDAVQENTGASSQVSGLEQATEATTSAAGSKKETDAKAKKVEIDTAVPEEYEKQVDAMKSCHKAWRRPWRRQANLC